MFLLNSRRARFAAATSGYKPYRGTPSPEVTGLICLVPERAFSRAPLDILLVYLCRFEVRFPQFLLRGFSRQRELIPLAAYATALRLTVNVFPDLPWKTGLRASIHIAICGRDYPSASPHRDNETVGVPEY